jgi:hypothetical protein
MLQEQTRLLIESMPGTDLLISWTITGSGPLLTRLRSGPAADQYLEKLRNLFGTASPSTWSVSLSAKMTSSPPRQWYEPSTIRGDFLRTIKHLKKEPDEPLGLERFLPEEAREDILPVSVAGNGRKRRSVLQDAALLGVDLLTGEEVGS